MIVFERLVCTRCGAFLVTSEKRRSFTFPEGYWDRKEYEDCRKTDHRWRELDPGDGS